MNSKDCIFLYSRFYEQNNVVHCYLVKISNWYFRFESLEQEYVIKDTLKLSIETEFYWISFILYYLNSTNVKSSSKTFRTILCLRS